MEVRDPTSGTVVPECGQWYVGHPFGAHDDTEGHIEQKLDKHIVNSVKHPEPSIQRLIKSYNAMCAEMRQLAPRRAYLPCPLDISDIYKLDVDDPIWHDEGLGEASEEAEGDVPCWMCDENVRNGIRHLLDQDRCIEEEQRLQKEHCTLQEWLREEWQCLLLAINDASMC